MKASRMMERVDPAHVKGQADDRGKVSGVPGFRK
jgi:hypothetical protein